MNIRDELRKKLLEDMLYDFRDEYLTSDETIDRILALFQDEKFQDEALQEIDDDAPLEIKIKFGVLTALVTAIDIAKQEDKNRDDGVMRCKSAIYDKAVKQILALTQRKLSKEKMANVIYDTIYYDGKPKQEISARLECLLLAQAIADGDVYEDN
jgi:hypothetical protein